MPKLDGCCGSCRYFIKGENLCRLNLGITVEVHTRCCVSCKPTQEQHDAALKLLRQGKPIDHLRTPGYERKAD